MISVYVISSNEDKQETRIAMKMLASAAIATHDWTTMNGKKLTKEKVESDFAELIKSDCAIVINAPRVTPGKYMEIGACKVLGKQVFFIGKPRGALGNFGTVVSSIKDAVDEISIARFKKQFMRNAMRNAMMDQIEKDRYGN